MYQLLCVRTWMLMVLWVLVSCDNSPPTCLPMSREDPVLLSQKDQNTQQAIRRILDETLVPCPLNLEGGESNCAPVDVVFKKKIGRPESVKQRVLVIDAGMWEETSLIFASRVLDLVEPDSRGNLSTVTLKQTFAKGALRIFHEEAGEKNHTFNFAAIEEFGREIDEKFLSPASSLAYKENDHGYSILSTLAILSPEAEFIVGLERGVPDEIMSEVCKGAEGSFERFAEYYDRLFGSYLSLIHEYGVRFINLSSGETLETTRASCPGISNERAKVILDLAYEHFYKPLGSIPNVILVQAGVNNVPRALNHNDPEFPIDCRPLQNRIRVGVVYWTCLDERALSDDVRLGQVCLDVSVNNGPSGKRQRESDPRRLDSYKHQKYCASGHYRWFCHVGTSYAAPLFLSHLIYLQETHPELDTTEKLIQKATEGGPLAVKDPGARKEFLRFSSNFLQPLSEQR